MKKARYDYVGFSLFVTIVALIIVFIITCLKKRNFVAALTAVTTLYATGALWYLNGDRQSIVGRYCFDEGDKVRRRKKKAKDTITELTHRRDSLPINEIPVDDETTEADFAR